MRGKQDEIGLQEGMSFQGRISSVSLATTAVVLAVACVVFLIQQWTAERASLLEHHRALAQISGQQARPALAEGRIGALKSLAEAIDEAGGVRAVFILDRDGRLVASAGDRGAEADVAPAAGERASQVRETLRDPAGRRIGEIVILSHLDHLGPLLARSAAIVFALFFGSSGLAIFMSRLLSDRLMRSIDAFTLAMRAMALSGDTTRRAPNLNDATFGRLTSSFNELMDKLQANEQALRHTLAELTAARDAAETANVLKSQFLANMSHEIRTPLNGVLAMAQVMESSGLEPAQRERLGIIRQSGEVLLAVLNDVLDLSKIEAGKMELEQVDFDGADLVRGVAGGFKGEAERKGLAFNVEIVEAAAGMRAGDPTRIRQILMNLLSNAVKFTSTGAVRVRCEGLGQDGAAGLAISVDDTGMGIAAEQLPHLFEKFTQADATTTRRYGGAGLGLAISRELAGLMDGTITVRSQEGRGSSFRLELPLRRTAPAPVQTEAPEASVETEVGAAVRILAAEDNPTNQRVLRAVLETFGVDLTLVENGREAVEAWTANPFDIVLMDIQMPEMDGVAATRAIRQAEAASGRPRTPIVALSANAMTHQVSEYLAAGMDAHVAKPIEMARLQAALENALAQSEARAAA